jgi:hypothetical protein
METKNFHGQMCIYYENYDDTCSVNNPSCLLCQNLIRHSVHFHLESLFVPSSFQSNNGDCVLEGIEIYTYIYKKYMNMYINLYLYICVYLYLCMFIHIYIERWKKNLENLVGFIMTQEYKYLPKHIAVQVDVIEEVCCPANSRAIRRPTISSSVKFDPSL